MVGSSAGVVDVGSSAFTAGHSDLALVAGGPEDLTSHRGPVVGQLSPAETLPRHFEALERA